MDTIEIDTKQYEVRQTDSSDKKWVQTKNGERQVVRINGTWKWKSEDPHGK